MSQSFLEAVCVKAGERFAFESTGNRSSAAGSVFFCTLFLLSMRIFPHFSIRKTHSGVGFLTALESFSEFERALR